MPGSNVIDLASRRPIAPADTSAARLPLSVQVEREALALVLPGYEWWLTPEQADELAADLRQGAAAARANRPRPRGA